MNHMTHDFDLGDYVPTNEEHKAAMERENEHILLKLDALTDEELADVYWDNYGKEPIEPSLMWEELRKDILTDKIIVI